MNLEAHNIFRIKNMILFAKDSLSFKEVLNWYLLKRLCTALSVKSTGRGISQIKTIHR